MGMGLRTEAGRYASTISDSEVQSWTRNNPDKRLLHMRTPNHCHGCGEPFPDTVVALPRKVISGVVLGMAIHSHERVPLCFGCAKYDPHLRARIECEGCGRTVYCRNVCSSRCAQRIARKRKREAEEGFCEGCGIAFKGRRPDAKHCSPACRQKAYRERKAA